MLQNMRDNTQGWITKLIIAIICLVFIVWGLEKMITPGNMDGKEIVKVNGKSITQQQYYNALQLAENRSFQSGKHPDPSKMHKQIIDHLIEQSVLSTYAKDHSLYVPDSEIDTLIVSMPAFQSNGRFDEDRFMSLVRGSNMTPVAFKENLRNDMTLSQLQSAIEQSGFVTKKQETLLNKLKNQKRDFSWATLSLSKEVKQQKVSDEEITKFYNTHKQNFMSDESVSVNYILLNQNELSHTIPVSDNAVQSAYENYKNEENEKPITPKLAMIMLKTSATHKEKQQLEKAKKIEDKLKKGASFASLVKQYSEDSKTREKSGVITGYTPGHYGFTFDDAVDVLEPEQVSKPIIAKQGVAIVKRLDDGKKHIKPLNQVRDSLISKLQKDKAVSYFQDHVQKLADLSFENTDIESPAKALGLTVKTTPFFSRNNGHDITANKKFIHAAFSEDVIQNNNNSDIVKISPEEVAVLHLKAYKPSHQMKLDEVREKVATLLKRQKAGKAILEDAKKAIAQLESGTSKASFAKSHNTHWKDIKNASRNQKNTPHDILQKAFSLAHPSDKNSSYGWLSLASGDVAIISVNKIITDSKKKKDNFFAGSQQDMSRQQGKINYHEFVRSLKDSADITVVEKNNDL